MIIGITGHRPNDGLGGYNIPNPIYNYVCSEMENFFIKHKVTKVISGMALGGDQYAANVAIKLNIPVLAAIPFVGQEKAWPENSQKLYFALLKKCSEKVIVSEGGYAAYKMQIRNEFIVNNSNEILAIYTGKQSGGTFNCIQYAIKNNKKINIIDPNKYELR